MIDTHQHFWRIGVPEQAWRTPARAAIDADYQPVDLLPQMALAGVDATVLVQSVNTPEENDRLRAYAEEAPFVAGVVGWLPLADPPAARRELDRSITPRWCGVRSLAGRDPLDPLVTTGGIELFRDLARAGLAWDVVPVTARQVDAVIEIARALPDLRIVVDHLARPPLDTAGWQPWADQIAALARCPGIALKVSVGIDVLTGWTWDAEALGRYVDRAARCFGPDRLMLASNWPVVLLRRSYHDAWRDLTDAVSRAGAGGHDLAQVCGGTAQRWYRLAHPKGSI